ncbi:hypothetical protein UVI_02021320 [Ustilaginoidea virens]|uniref:MARVEL domain-containing protein n=1 Tax=Ustilaginoidea virens TaxID=1159556 RepID=A0A1B5KXM9_USTVR|nr:hypothetical protein UVI_02021320 [Ustilaginoidea virens]
MGAKSGMALKSLQWFFRGVQFLCAIIVLGIFSYFLAALHNHDLQTDTSVRAVAGISGAAALYTLLGLVFLCCVAGLTFTSFVAMVLDFCFAACFVYVAVVNRNGASTCRGYVDTPFGRGPSGDTASAPGGFTALPSFHTACRLQTACMAVSIIAIFFFIFSMPTEMALVRHRRNEKMFGPGAQKSFFFGLGTRQRGFWGRFRRRNKGGLYDETSRLPEHTHPDQLADSRHSYATDHTAVNPDGHGLGAEPPPASYKYDDGIYEHP